MQWRASCWVPIPWRHLTLRLNLTPLQLSSSNWDMLVSTPACFLMLVRCSATTLVSSSFILKMPILWTFWCEEESASFSDFQNLCGASCVSLVTMWQDGKGAMTSINNICWCSNIRAWLFNIAMLIWCRIRFREDDSSLLEESCWWWVEGGGAVLAMALMVNGARSFFATWLVRASNWLKKQWSCCLCRLVVAQ